MWNDSLAITHKDNSLVARVKKSATVQIITLVDKETFADQEPFTTLKAKLDGTSNVLVGGYSPVEGTDNVVISKNSLRCAQWKPSTYTGTIQSIATSLTPLKADMWDNSLAFAYDSSSQLIAQVKKVAGDTMLVNLKDSSLLVSNVTFSAYQETVQNKHTELKNLIDNITTATDVKAVAEQLGRLNGTTSCVVLGGYSTTANVVAIGTTFLSEGLKLFVKKPLPFLLERNVIEASDTTTLNALWSRVNLKHALYENDIQFLCKSCEKGISEQCFLEPSSKQHPV